MSGNKMTYSTSPLTDEFGNSIVADDVVLGLIKVCADPLCGNIYHNCPFEVKRCECGGGIKMINQDTFFKKFSNTFFQYDQPSGEYYRPRKQSQISLNENI